MELRLEAGIGAASPNTISRPGSIRMGQPSPQSPRSPALLPVSEGESASCSSSSRCQCVDPPEMPMVPAASLADADGHVPLPAPRILQTASASSLEAGTRDTRLPEQLYAAAVNRCSRCGGCECVCPGGLSRSAVAQLDHAALARALGVKPEALMQAFEHADVSFRKIAFYLSLFGEFLYSTQRAKPTTVLVENSKAE